MIVNLGRRSRRNEDIVEILRVIIMRLDVIDATNKDGLQHK